jgi:hypothetical protein
MAADTVDHDVNEPFRRAALLAFAEDDEFFARTRLTVLAVLALLVQECKY